MVRNLRPREKGTRFFPDLRTCRSYRTPNIEVIHARQRKLLVERDQRVSTVLNGRESEGRDWDLEAPEPVGGEDDLRIEASAISTISGGRSSNASPLSRDRSSSAPSSLRTPKTSRKCGVPLGDHRGVGDRLEELELVPVSL